MQYEDLQWSDKMRDAVQRFHNGDISRSRLGQIANRVRGLCSCGKIPEAGFARCWSCAKRENKHKTEREKRLRATDPVFRAKLNKKYSEKQKAKIREKYWLGPEDPLPQIAKGGRPRGGKNKCSICKTVGHTAPSHDKHIDNTLEKFNADERREAQDCGTVYSANQ